MRRARTWLATLGLVLAVQTSAVETTPPAEPRLSTVRVADGTVLLVAEAGDRASPGILFIHGFAQSYLAFRRQFGSELARHYHLVAFDLRGHGGSTKPSDPAAYTDVARSGDDVAAVIAATGLKRPVIVGWSYGGVVVGDYLRGHGAGNVAGIVFAGTLGGFVKPGAPLAPDAMLNRIRLNSANSRSLDLTANIAAADSTSAAYATPEMTAADRQLLFATEIMLPAYVRRAMAQRQGDNSDIVDRLAAVPVLLVRGSGERGMPEPELAQLQARLPRSRLSRYDGAGHLAFFEQAGHFDTELAAFVTAVNRPVDPAAAIRRPGFPLSLAEHRRFRDQEFAATDRNGDGVIDLAELRLRAEAAFGTTTPERLARAMRINCGHDALVCTAAEFRAQGDAEFRRVDRDGDGVVNMDEFRAAGSDFHLEKF